MRALLSFVWPFVFLVGFASCQRRFQGFPSRINRPQQFPGQPPFINDGNANLESPAAASSGARGCFCLPGNQLCQTNGVIPEGAVRISNIDTRIVNTNPQSSCPQGQNECCFGSLGPGEPDPFPNPTPLTDCGSRRSIQPGRPGTADADFGEYPWMAAILGRRDQFVAAGALISPLFVLTAAHKITEPGNLRVRIGDYNLAVANEVRGFPHQDIPVRRVIIHPQFHRGNLSNDVALLQLQRPVNPSRHITTVCLPERGQRFSGQRCFLSGWGQNLDGQFQNILNEVDLPVIDPLQCEQSLRRTRLGNSFVLDQNSFLCAGGEEGKDACRGDGGAPLVCNENGVFTVIGLVAWGIECGQNDVPGVYVNVPNFSEFIKSQINGQ